mmetsp:Transcript_57102/g.90972  ORF Transcript_57102/g.90972 Transcript_57102/m.90972 type:complete len:226 (-) Transcript_57102:12-689(-)
MVMIELHIRGALNVNVIIFVLVLHIDILLFFFLVLLLVIVIHAIAMMNVLIGRGRRAGNVIFVRLQNRHCSESGGLVHARSFDGNGAGRVRVAVILRTNHATKAVQMLCLFQIERQTDIRVYFQLSVGAETMVRFHVQHTLHVHIQKVHVLQIRHTRMIHQVHIHAAVAHAVHTNATVAIHMLGGIDAVAVSLCIAHCFAFQHGCFLELDFFLLGERQLDHQIAK